VVSGQVKQIARHDYALTEAEKGLGYILACSNTAVTDVVLEADEAHGSYDIPDQEIEIKVKKISPFDDRVIFLHARTPRTKRLRFLAGQYLSLNVAGLPVTDMAIASCPCDDMNLQFHIPIIAGDPFSEKLADCLKAGDNLVINGPSGEFILNEDSPRSLVFIACNTGFAAIKSLIEHAMALDTAEDIHLYWISTPGNHHYLDNLCRSWDDALDNFHYTALAATDSKTVENLLPDITASLADASEHDYYACMPAPLLDLTRDFLVAAGVPAHQQKLEPIRHDPGK
jgi:CDP-4-dehydro-6-deoxyglucose reductase